MGVYFKNGTLYNHRPYYIKDTNNRYLFYSDNGTWQIGDTLGSGERIRTLATELDNLPLGEPGGWEYWHGAKYNYDPYITVSMLGKLTLGQIKGEEKKTSPPKM